MSPGEYITRHRLAAGMSHEDVALCLDTEPPVAARRRADLLISIEIDALPVRLSTIHALVAIPQLAIDGRLLATLVDEWNVRTNGPHLVRFVPTRVLDETR